MAGSMAGPCDTDAEGLADGLVVALPDAVGDALGEPEAAVNAGVSSRPADEADFVGEEDGLDVLPMLVRDGLDEDEGVAEVEGLAEVDGSARLRHTDALLQHRTERQLGRLVDLVEQIALVLAGDGHHDRGVAAGALTSDLRLGHTTAVDALPDDVDRLVDQGVGHLTLAIGDLRDQRDARATLQVEPELGLVVPGEAHPGAEGDDDDRQDGEEAAGRCGAGGDRLTCHDGEVLLKVPGWDPEGVRRARADGRGSIPDLGRSSGHPGVRRGPRIGRESLPLTS